MTRRDPKTELPPEPTGALILWQEELRLGRFGQDAKRPSTWKGGALMIAACQDANGIDALRQGLVHSARSWFAAAEQTLLEAHQAKQKRRRRAA